MTLIALVFAGAFPAVPTAIAQPVIRAQASDSAKVRRMWQDLDLAALMPILRDEALVEASLMQENMLRGSDDARWLQIVTQIHAPGRLKEHFTAGAVAGLGNQQGRLIDRALAFYDSDLGQRVVRLETTARRAMLDPDTEKLAREAFLDAASHGSPRIEQIARLIDGADLIGPNVAGGMNALVAFSRGFAEGDGYGLPMTEQQMLADAWAQEPEIRAQTLGWMEAYLLLAYSPLSDEELEQYIAFAESPEGKALSSVVFAGFDALFQRTSWDLGMAAAGHMQGHNL